MRHKRRFPLLLGLLVALAVTLAACGGGDDDVGRIAFTSVRDGDDKEFEIYVINADGTGLTRLTRSGGGSAWSPDGAKIAFTSIRAGDDSFKPP